MKKYKRITIEELLEEAHKEKLYENEDLHSCHYYNALITVMNNRFEKLYKDLQNE